MKFFLFLMNPTYDISTDTQARDKNSDNPSHVQYNTAQQSCMNITPNNLPIISNARGTGIPSLRVTCGVLWGPTHIPATE